MHSKEFIAHIQDDAVVRAIQVAEQNSTAELRVMVTGRKVTDPLREAWSAFARHGMDRTRERNAILIFLAPETRQFALIRDEGFNSHDTPERWQHLAATLEQGFRSGDYTSPLVAVITELGKWMANCFPRQADDVNELPDGILRE